MAMEARDDVPLREYIEAMLREHAKSHEALAENVKTALAAMDRRLDGMNEFRQSLEDFQSRSVPRDMFDQRTDQVNQRLGAIERVIVGREVFTAALEARDNEIDSLKAWRAKASGVAIVCVLFAGVIGAAVMKALGGG